VLLDTTVTNFSATSASFSDDLVYLKYIPSSVFAQQEQQIKEHYAKYLGQKNPVTVRINPFVYKHCYFWSVFVWVLR
jgi:hypothetical protein